MLTGDSSSDYEADEEYGQEGEGYASEMGYASEPSAHFLHVIFFFTLIL